MTNETLRALQQIGNGAYSHFNTILNSYASAKHCIENNIEGDFVECGVAAAAQISAMAQAGKDLHTRKTIWAYDSYRGIPLACEIDDQQPAIEYFKEPKPFVEDKRTLLVSSGATVHSLENVKENLGKWGVPEAANYKFIEGWFQDTLPIHAKDMDKISILRLDGDLYDSTRVCLEYLFPKLVSGGILIIDDWALKGCRVACDEYFGDYSQLGELNAIAETTPVWFIKK